MTDQLFSRYGRTLTAGEVLFREGEPGGEMYIVRTGAIRVSINADDRVKTLAILRTGEFVGEMSLLNSKPRSATATAEEDTALIVVTGPALEEMIVTNTEIALRLLRKLAKRLETTDSLLRVLLYRDPKDRVIENLKRLALLHGWKQGSEVAFSANCDDMAEQIGLTTAEVQEVIARLIRAGALLESDGSWHIKAPEKLEEVLLFLKMKEQFR